MPRVAGTARATSLEMKLALPIAALAIITSASSLVRAQEPEPEAPSATPPGAPPAPPPLPAPPPPRPPPPLYYPTVPEHSAAPAPTFVVRRGMPAPRNALELSFATGYTQGFGS